MAVIKKLSQEIIGQIAAGEVVERPAAAVKELVENSIDAGAKNITVELREGGIKYLRVSDNGRGIPAEQIRMAFERHATSKISEAKDLFDIHTLGFRGEALASIAAVSRVTCTTRTQDADFGTRAVVEAGEFTDIRQAASPVGTTIVAEDLFYNTPVRLKFLKKPAAEATMVSDYMLRLILSHPEVSFRYVSQGKTVYHSTGDGKIESALYALYGREAFQQMRKVSGHMNGVLLSGYVGVGELSRGNRAQQSFFVNGRYFRSALLSHALEKGCEGRVMVGRFPMCALFLELPRQQVDVNVHPNKLEVRFQNEIAIAAAIETLVREAMHAESLGAKLNQPLSAPVVDAPKPAFTVVEMNPPKEEAKTETPVPEAEKPRPLQVDTTAEDQISQAVANLKPVVIDDAPKAEPLRQAPSIAAMYTRAVTPPPVVRSASPAPVVKAEIPKPVSVGAAKPVEAPKPAAVVVAVPEKKETPPAQPVPVEEQTVLAEVQEAPVPLRLAGILFDTYWMFESGDRVLMVDQHAAHERILYDQMMERFEKDRISQKLLAPQLVQLTPYDMAHLPEFAPLLSQAGFEVEQFDDTCVALHAIPTFFGVNDSPKELLLEALAEWQAGRGEVTRERMRRRVAQMACKRAIKGGDKLSETEIRGFMQEMLKSESMPTCPHGRPIVTEITRYALEKRFKRVQ
ncbi:MAG: DNA mismatch repair endonuclease MutL [bacterium]|nr:DNA mismatch repair endonuclease MutL [bacterium]